MYVIPRPRHWAGLLGRRTAALLGPALLAAAVLAPGAGPARAQALFSPAITVNEDVVSYFELQQRAQFLRLLRAPGDPDTLAREVLIEDRLKSQAAAEAGIVVSPEDITAGIEEFATRTGLSGEEFLQALADGGVTAETMRDFTEIGLIWREFIRARFLERARPSDAEIDRALGRAGDADGGGVRVLLSEIIIPLTPQTEEQVQALALQLAQITGFEAFSDAAEQYSATETRARGGRMDWLPISELPPALRPVILALSPGEITAPIQLPNAVALFQMRDIQETGIAAPRYSAIEYATVPIAGGRSAAGLAAAAAIAGRVDTCDDLYGVARGQPPEALQRTSLPPAEIPRDIARELARLDEGEISTALTRDDGNTLLLVMLCGRTAELNEDASREDVAAALTQQRLNAFSQSYLEQLRADALIVEK